MIDTAAVAVGRVALSGEHDGHRGPGCAVDLDPGRVASRRRDEHLEKIAFEHRDERLRLGIAEAAVEFEHPRAIRSQHQACIQEADERSTPLRELRKNRDMN